MMNFKISFHLLFLTSVILFQVPVYGAAQELTYETIIVEFNSENTKLSGIIWKPLGKGPFPGVAIVHGSGRADKYSNIGMAEYFLQAGLAVISYDKRGVNDSKGKYFGIGPYDTEKLTLLAYDALNALNKMKSYTFIDKDKIGFWGASQAGWIIPIANSFSAEIKFNIIMSGPTVTIGEEDYYSKLTGDDFGKYYSISMDEISEKLKEVGPYGFDPVPYIEQMKQSTLWIFGTEDRSIPVKESVDRLVFIIENENINHTFKVFKGANHGLRRNGRLVMDFWSVQENFLRKNKIIK